LKRIHEREIGIMGQATVVSLKARPWQSALLCFEVGGILETLNPNFMYGAPVTAFIFSTVYGTPLPSPSGDPSLLAKSADIWAQLQPNYLANLRAEPRRASLDMAVNARQNAYYARYSPTASAAIAAAANCYNPTNPSNNLSMLKQLVSLSNTQAAQLTSAYNAAPPTANPPRGWPTYPTGNPAVVPYTVSQLKSTTYTTDSSTATPTLTTTTTPSLTTTTTPNLTTTTTGQSSQAGIVDGPGADDVSLGGNKNINVPIPPAGGAPITNWWFDTGGHAQASVEDASSGETSTQSGTSSAVESGTSTDTETGKELSTGGAYAVESETIQNYDYAFRVPYVEAVAQNLRAQISLNDQQFSLTLATQNVPNLATVLQNESNSVDLAVYQMQVGFINTVLLPTITGTITGIFKYPGDPVRAGEPVIRIDDNSQMLVVARLVYPGPINVGTLTGPPVTGSQVTITTNLFDANAEPVPPALLTSLPGTVVALRGAGDDDLWDVVILCKNPTVSGLPVYPIGYTFDYDNTSVTIT
jgi:hypothetical protein